MKESPMNSIRKKRKKKRARLRALLLGLIGTAAILITGFIAASVYFETHFFPHTSILGIDCGGKTVSYVEDKLADRASSYLLTVLDRQNEKYLVRGIDIDCAYVNTGEVDSILSDQLGIAFLSNLSNQKEYDLEHEITFDRNALSSLVSGFAFMDPANMEPPIDAKLTITDSGYELIPENPGTTVIPDQVQADVLNAVESQLDTLTLSDSCYVSPEITVDSPEITEIKDQMDRFLHAEVTYLIGDEEMKLDSVEIAALLDIDMESRAVSVNSDRVADYVQQMAYKLNTYGKSRQFRTTQGDTITIGGGDYGWVVDKAGEAEQLLSDLHGGIPVTREPVYEQTALYRGEDDIGDTYIEIDYTNQHLYYYKEGSLMEDTDIVSGNISKNNGSPDGVFKIVYKESPAVLVGENYESNVTYFMPFAYNVGIHDADWRSAFGGEIYKTSGSHGCINVPKEKAERLYEIVEKGTPVIAYYRSPVTLTAENARISNAYSYDKEAAANKAAAEDSASAAAAAQAAAEQAALAAALGLTDPAALVPTQTE